MLMIWSCTYPFQVQVNTYYFRLQTIQIKAISDWCNFNWRDRCHLPTYTSHCLLIEFLLLSARMWLYDVLFVIDIIGIIIDCDVLNNIFLDFPIVQFSVRLLLFLFIEPTVIELLINVLINNELFNFFKLENLCELINLVPEPIWTATQFDTVATWINIMKLSFFFLQKHFIFLINFKRIAGDTAKFLCKTADQQNVNRRINDTKKFFLY